MRPKFEGRLTISRRQGHDDGKPIHITLRDEASGVELFDAALTFEDFARALVGQGELPCTFEPAPPARMALLGTKREHKQVVLHLSKQPDKHVAGGMDEAIEQLATFEVDGWLGDRDDLVNHHRSRSVGVGTAREITVTMRRHVRADGTPVARP